MATAHKIRAIIHARERSGASHPQRLLNRSNRTIGPLFSLDAAGTLSMSMSEHMAKRLDIAQLRHVGKNIRILTTDEHKKHGVGGLPHAEMARLDSTIEVARGVSPGVARLVSRAADQ
eukprot:scaffold1515_cov119-Isochrysis_galbana.AAC.4